LEQVGALDAAVVQGAGHQGACRACLAASVQVFCVAHPARDVQAGLRRQAAQQVDASQVRPQVAADPRQVQGDHVCWPALRLLEQRGLAQ